MNADENSLIGQRWNWIEQHQDEIATSLRAIQPELPRHDKRVLAQLSHWFLGNISFEAATRRPDVLAVCLALAKIPLHQQDSPTAIDRAVRLGFCSLIRFQSAQRSLTSMLRFPALLLLTMAVMTTCFCIFIAPLFQVLFIDFELRPPRLTELILKTSLLVRNVWIFGLVALVLLATTLVFLNIKTRNQRVAGEYWLDQKLKSYRNQAASWAWHMAVLLDSGLPLRESIKIAGETQSHRWLREAGTRWLEKSTEPSTQSKSETPSLFGARFQLLEATLQVPSVPAQVDLFRETATFYWSCHRNIGEWWVAWITKFLLALYLGGIAITVYALYAPLIAIITGLT